MAKLVNELLPEVVEVSDGKYSGQKVFKVVLTGAGDKFFLAYTTEQADKIADQIASDLSDTIATQEALVPVYVQKGIAQE